jgi:hypothetical protein
VKWKTRNSDGSTERTIGPNVAPTWWFGGGPDGMPGDYAVVRIDSPTENPAGAIYTGSSNLRAILVAETWTPLSWAGFYVCKRGSFSGDQCGVIVSGFNFVTYGSVGVTVITADAQIFGCKGDSGGPVYLGANGFGITSGGSTEFGICGSTTHFQPLATALKNLKVSLA